MDTSPPLEGPLLLATQIEFVGSTTAAGTLYGIGFTLYCLYLRASIPRSRDQNRRRQAQFMIAYSTIIMICAFYFLISNAWVVQDAYIKHSDFPGGPLIYENSTFHTQPVIAVGIVCQSAVDILTAAILIWRLWVVWSGTRYARLVVILPLLSLLGFAALQIRVTVLDITLIDADVTGSQGVSLGTAEMALRGTAIILPTILIVGFITFESRRQSRLTGQSQMSPSHMSVVAMLIESYALESAWTIALSVLYSIHHPAEQFFNDTLTYIEIIAYLLVLYRVANGRTYGSQGLHGSSSKEDNTSSIRWNHTIMPSGLNTITDVDPYSSRHGLKPDACEEKGSPV